MRKYLKLYERARVQPENGNNSGRYEWTGLELGLIGLLSVRCLLKKQVSGPPLDCLMYWGLFLQYYCVDFSIVTLFITRFDTSFTFLLVSNLL